MQLSPGPWVALPLVDTPPTPENPGFLKSQSELLAPLDTFDADTTLAVQAMTEAAGPDAGTDADEPLQAAEWGLNTESEAEESPEIFDALYAQDEIDAYVQHSEDALPVEAYEPIPGSTPDYDERQQYTDLEYVTVDELGNPVVQPPVRQYAATVTLQNVSRGGSDKFYVGDAFKLTVQGPANRPVRVEAVHSGDFLSPTVFGDTDDNGAFVIENVFDQSSQGYWQETWLVDEIAAYPVLHFAVL